MEEYFLQNTGFGRQEIWETIQRLRPIDNIFMVCMYEGNIPLLNKTVRILMQKHDLNITDSRKSSYLSYVKERKVMAWAYDKRGNEYEVSIKCVGHVNADQLPEKVMDLHAERRKRDEAAESPHRYDIRIAENDLFGEDRPVYPVISKKSEDEPFKRQILYINGMFRGESALSCLMHDFHCRTPESMLFYEMRAATIRCKRTPEGLRRVVKALITVDL